MFNSCTIGEITAVDCAAASEALVLLLVAQFTAENNMLSVVLKTNMANCLVIFNFSCLSRIRINCNYNGAGSPHTPGRDPSGGSAPGGTRCPSKTRPTGQALLLVLEGKVYKTHSIAQRSK